MYYLFAYLHQLIYLVNRFMEPSQNASNNKNDNNCMLKIYLNDETHLYLSLPLK